VPDWREYGMHGIDVYSVIYKTALNATKVVVVISSPSSGGIGSGDPMALRRRGCRVDVITEVMQPLELSKVKERDVSDADTWLQC
jgi:hypothetical protein